MSQVVLIIHTHTHTACTILLYKQLLQTLSIGWTSSPDKSIQTTHYCCLNEIPNSCNCSSYCWWTSRLSLLQMEKLMNINEIIHAYIVCMYQHYLISLLIIIISFFIIKYPVMQYNNIKSLPPPQHGIKKFNSRGSKAL